MSQRIKIASRYSLLSPAMMWTGMLFACLARIMHITPLLTPLWNDNASLGHGICIELAPVVAAAQHRAANHHASAHSLHHDDPHSKMHSGHPVATAASTMASMPSASQNPAHRADILTLNADEHQGHLMAMDATAKASEDKDSKNHAKHHNSCDICTSMGGFTLPMDLPPLEIILVELFTASVMVFYQSYILKNLPFLHPLSRAPPF